MIPDGWEIKPLQDCCVGKPQYGANAAAVAYSELLPRYIRITDIDENGKLIDDTKVSIGLEGNEKYILRPNDFLFARSGATVGKTYLYFEADGLAIYAGYLIKFRIDSNILLPEHLKHYTQTTKYWVLSLNFRDERSASDLDAVAVAKDYQGVVSEDLNWGKNR
jgi:type I restriction enzyme S subunit